MTEPHIERAEILGRLGRWEEALTEYDRAAALSTDAGIALGRALALFHLDDPGAETALSQVYQTAMDQRISTVALTALSYQAALAQRALNKGARQRGEVVEIYTQAIALGETAASSDYLAVLYLNRANLNRDSGDVSQRDAAAADYHQAVKLDPGCEYLRDGEPRKGNVSQIFQRLCVNSQNSQPYARI